MPARRSPLLAFLLALALVAYPATMPVAMASETPTSMPAGMRGGADCGHRHGPAGHQHHHALSTCCAGVCGSCPVLAINAGLAPRIRTTARVVTVQLDAPAVLQHSALVHLPYAIGPPVSLV